jgi:hypothetical protein
VTQALTERTRDVHATCARLHSRGMALLARLLSDPGREFHVLDLVGNVQRRISHALTQIRTASARLGEHLDANVKTGTFCSYALKAGSAEPTPHRR